MINHNYIYKNYRQILITVENYQRLKNIGSFQESFNDVISKLLEKYETKQITKQGDDLP
jgi:predicted CopG family antitoxin